MKYDYILFENLYEVENHYKDLELFASLLKEAGYSVAIANVFKEASLCKNTEIPHISFFFDSPQKFRNPDDYMKKESSLKNLYWRIRKDLYLIKILRNLRGLAPNVYMGSLTLATPALFFNFLDKHTNYLMWALRSSHALNWKNSRKTDLFYWVSKFIYKNIHYRRNLRLIVSNILIKSEFEKEVNIELDRLILRPERTISELKPLKESSLGKIKLLTIGTLRPFKHVEFCLDVLRELNNPHIEYTIAGRCKDNLEYEQMIYDRMKGVPNVKWINKFIPDDEYESLVNDCDFLMLCDGTQKSCASNGTMSEALLHGKPIIAPDFNPFKYEVETFKIGELYEYQNKESLSKILLNVLEEGTGKYYTPIIKYQEKFLKKNVINELKIQLEK